MKKLLPAIAATALTLVATVASAEGPAAFRRHPYLQGLGSDRVLVRFELSDPAPAVVAVTGPDGKTRDVAASEPSAFHSVAIDKLAPATAYRYEVRLAATAKDGSAAAPAEGATFTTAPVDARPFSFIVLGDNRSDAATHAAIVRAVERAPGDFLVNTGDMTVRGSDQDDWSQFFAIEGRLLASRCLFAVVGNHELVGTEPNGPVSYLRYFSTAVSAGQPRLYDTFRWSNTRFFLLNAMDEWTGAEKDWLAAELAKSDAEPGIVHRIAVLHIGPYSSGPHGGNRALVAAGIPALMREHKVDLVLAGHDHIYERGDAQGLKYFVSGGAGAPLYDVKRKIASSQRVESVHHWIEIAVDGDSVKTVARRLDGTTIESCGFKVGSPFVCESPPEAAKPPPPPIVPEKTPDKCACRAPGTASGSGGHEGWVGVGLVGLLLLRRRAQG